MLILFKCCRPECTPYSPISHPYTAFLHRATHGSLLLHTHTHILSPSHALFPRPHAFCPGVGMVNDTPVLMCWVSHLDVIVLICV